MAENYLISFCIPTYNRCGALQLCVESIAGQKEFEDLVEIVVCDNASTDGTAEMMQAMQEKYSNVFYYRNKENVGMERNFCLALNHGKGKLLKLLNDYSSISAEAMTKLIDIVRKNSDESAVIFFHKFKLEPYEIVCNDFNAFLQHTTYWSTWIGCFSIWKNDYDKIENKERFEGMLFFHLLLLVDYFKQKKKMVIYNYPFFENVIAATKGGYDFFNIFIGNFIGKIIQPLYKEGYINLKTLYKIKAKFASKFLRIWLVTIYFKSAKNNFAGKKGMSLIFKYFKFYPQLYATLGYLAMYYVYAKIKK